MDIHKSIMDIHNSGYGYPKFGIMDIHKYMHLMSTSKPVSMTSQSLYCRGQRRVCCYCCRRAAAIITAQSGCRLLLLYASYCMHIVAVCILLPLLLPACYWYLDNLVVRYFCRSCLPAAAGIHHKPWSSLAGCGEITCDQEHRIWPTSSSINPRQSNHELHTLVPGNQYGLTHWLSPQGTRRKPGCKPG